MRKRIIWALLVGTLLALSGCGASTHRSARASTSPTAKAAAVTTGTTTGGSATPPQCGSAGSNQVNCVLPDVQGTPYVVLQGTQSSLLSTAQQVNSSISASTPMVITAYGGSGGKGYQPAAPGAGGKGNPGEAQTATTIGSYYSAYKTAILYDYIAHGGSYTNKGNTIFDFIPTGGVGGMGGASTIVSPNNLTSSCPSSGCVVPCITGYSGEYNESGCASTNVLLVAGGGGGGGEGGSGCSGGGGGSGGVAVATTNGDAGASGTNGGSTGCGGGAGGHAGSFGTGYGGGKHGDGLYNSTGGHANSGVGGMGGPVTSGPPEPWDNVGYCMWAIGNSGYSSSNSLCPTSQSSPPEWGEGGEGKWGGYTQPIGGGGSGGGGWGGGGGGGAGGNSDPGGGGAGAGSFAIKATTSVPADFTTPSDGELCSGCNSGSTGEVVVSFVTG